MDGSFGPEGLGRREQQADQPPAAVEQEWSLSAGQVAAAVAAIIVACWAFGSLG